jgi:iron complex transport system ATP-binding protein
MPSDSGGLHVRQASYRYGDRFVLTDVSLDLSQRTMVALAGPNGSGKSTLLRIMAGLRPPASGSVQLDHQPMATLSPRERAHRVSTVPQNVSPSLGFRVGELVAMGRTPFVHAFGSRSGEDRRAVEAALTATGTVALARRRFGELSAGEQQRVVLAMALAQETPYLLLDEPTIHLDLQHQHELLELLRRLHSERSLGILAVMHDLNLAALYFDRLAVLSEGRLVAHGPPGELLRRADVLAVFRAPLAVISHPQTGVPQLLLQRTTPPD